MSEFVVAVEKRTRPRKKATDRTDQRETNRLRPYDEDQNVLNISFVFSGAGVPQRKGTGRRKRPRLTPRPLGTKIFVNILTKKRDKQKKSGENLEKTSTTCNNQTKSISVDRASEPSPKRLSAIRHKLISRPRRKKTEWIPVYFSCVIITTVTTTTIILIGTSISVPGKHGRARTVILTQGSRGSKSK